jgi:hypothetical protein
MRRLWPFVAVIALELAAATGDDSLLVQLRAAAKQGSARAQSELGSVYFYGRLEQKPDHAQAVHWYTQAAGGGDAQAQLNLGICYEQGLGVKADKTKALAFYRLAADQGVQPAIVNVGFALKEQGDLKTAAAYFLKGAEQNNRHCQREYGRLLSTDALGPPDPLAAKSYLEKAVAAGDILAAGYLALLLNGSIPEIPAEPRRVFDLLLKASENNDPEALSKVGYCYEEGIGVERSTDMAVSWYRRAAERGHPPAMINLADCLRDGRGTPQDPVAACAWYKVAHEQQSPLGTFNYAVCLATGTGIARSDSAARDLFRQAAESGLAIAQYNLAVFLQDGRGGDTDPVAAAHWLLKAANGGHAAAMEALADCYRDGRGVPPDPQAAADWQRKAAARRAATP